jgi:ABC-2 type transport system ATP-binding protein
MNAIYAADLSKTYDGKSYALSNLSLNIPHGGVCGFLGPNGAGKTTTVKLLTGLLTPSGGECEVMGISPVREPERVHAVCGVLTETAKMYGQMTGMENLVFFAQACGIATEPAKQRASDLLKKLDIWDARDKKASAYSTGMAQRLSLARALINNPQVLFLDEPTSGLDPESAQAVNELITELAKKEGTTVFLCTHQLRYAQDICDQYGLIDQGRLLAFGDFDTLSTNIGCKIKAGIRLKPDDSIDCFKKENDWWQTEIQEEEEMPQLLKRLMGQGHDIYEAKLVKPTLKDVYFGYLDREQEAKS